MVLGFGAAQKTELRPADFWAPGSGWVGSLTHHFVYPWGHPCLRDTTSASCPGMFLPASGGEAAIAAADEPDEEDGVHVEGEVVPQGWVYVIRNTETPWLFKIGKTYPDGMQSRLSEARRWGCFKLEEKYWFEDALKAEKEVHAMLREHNMRKLGFEDCGTELFKCWNIGTITDAIKVIICIVKNIKMHVIKLLQQFYNAYICVL